MVKQTKIRHIYKQKNLKIPTFDEMYYITQLFPEWVFYTGHYSLHFIK